MKSSESDSDIFALKNPDSNLLESLQLTNRYLTYVYLVDANAKIRFRAVGAAKEEELEILSKLTKDVIKNSQ